MAKNLQILLDNNRIALAQLRARREELEQGIARQIDHMNRLKRLAYEQGEEIK